MRETRRATLVARRRDSWHRTMHQQGELLGRLVRLARSLGAPRRVRRSLAEANLPAAREGGLQ